MSLCDSYILFFCQDMEGMDLDTLAPYISMDDDFQLTVLSSLPEEADKPSSERPAVTPAATVSRKRYDRPVFFARLCFKDCQKCEDVSDGVTVVTEEEESVENKMCAEERDGTDI